MLYIIHNNCFVLHTENPGLLQTGTTPLPRLQQQQLRIDSKSNNRLDKCCIQFGGFREKEESR